MFPPSVFAQVEPLLPALMAAPKPEIGDIASRRSGVEGLFNALFHAVPDVLDIERSIIYYTRAQDGFEVPIHRFARKGIASESATPVPAIVHIHGGDYICLSVDMYKKSI
jgi:hypothetical protein